MIHQTLDPGGSASVATNTIPRPSHRQRNLDSSGPTARSEGQITIAMPPGHASPDDLAQCQMPTRRLALLGLSGRRELAEPRPCRVDALAEQELRLYRENILGALPLSESVTVRLG